MNRRPPVLAAVALAAASLLAACAGTTSGPGSWSDPGDGDGGATVRVADLSTANVLTLGRGSGLVDDALEAEGLRAQWLGPFSVPTVAYDALIADQADVGSTGASRLVVWAAEERDLVAFALETYSGDSQGVVARGDAGVGSVEDLRGRSVAVGPAPGGTGDYVLAKALAGAGLTGADVQKVYMSDSDAAAAFVGGTVDAWASYDQFFAMAQSTPGAVVVAQGDEIGSNNASVHVVSRAYADEHPEAVAALYDGLVAQAEAVAEKPSAITDLYSRAGAPGDAIKVIGTFDVPQVVPLDGAGVERLQALARDYAELGFIGIEPDMGDVAYDVTAAPQR